MSLNTILVFITSAASILLSIIVFINDRKNPQNISLCLLSLSIAMWTFGQGMGDLFSDKSSVLFWTKINIGAAVLLAPLYYTFIMAFLNKRLNRNLSLWIMFMLAGGFLGLLFTPYFVRDIVTLPNYKYYPQGGPAYLLFAVFLMAVFIYGLIQLVYALMRSVDPEKTKIIYVLMASLIGFFGGITAFFPIFGINFPVVSHFAMPVYVAITAYAIIKHKLLNIDFVIREGLVYSVLTLLFAGIYALLIVSTNKIFQNLAHLNEYWAIITVVGVSVAVFQPLKDRVQDFIDRIFYRGTFYYEKTIKDLSQENKKLFQTLLRADKLTSLGTMAAGMAHEIKNPLASIKAMTQILPENLGNADFIKDYYDMIPRQLDRINQIVENLLKSGKQSDLDRSSINIDDLLTDILCFYSKSCDRNGVELKIYLSASVEIFGSNDQLRQALTNIILNAIDAMPQGGNLEISTSVKDNELLIVIKDNGMGIPRDKINYIFDPFYSLKEKGTGLGLFVAYRVIEAHNGRIDVESKEGEGTTFKIWLYIKPKE